MYLAKQQSAYRFLAYAGLAGLLIPTLELRADEGGTGDDSDSCFEVHPEPGCDDLDCQEAVCAEDPWCCNEHDDSWSWDQPCEGLAIALCSNCGDTNAGDCLSANGTPGCDEEDCCGQVCQLIPHCCEDEWDSECADLAATLQEILGECTSPGIIMDGLANNNLGQSNATLNRNNQLVVSNIGSSGDDGVFIELGEADRWDVEILSFDREGDLPEGALVEFRAFGRMNDDPDSRLGTLRAEVVEGALKLTPDFVFQGSSTYTAQVFHDGALLYTQSGVSGDLVAIAGLGPDPTDSIHAYGYKLGEGGFCFCIDITTDCCGVSCSCEPDQEEECGVEYSCTGILVGDLSFIGDRVLFMPDSVASPVDSVSAVDVAVANLETLIITDESLTVFDSAHRGLGIAFIQGAADNNGGKNLVVNNIGSSGLDGVSIDLVEAGGFAMEWEPLTPAGGVFAPGTCLTLTAQGSLGGGPDQVLGSLTLVSTAASVDIFADYADLGSATVRVDVFDDGVLVGSFPGIAGALAASVPSHQWPTGCGKQPSAPPFDLPCYVLTWPENEVVEVIVPGQSLPIEGDELRILAEVDTVLVQSLSSFAIQSAGIGNLVIMAEDIEQVGCEGDANGDGVVDPLDSGYVLARFGCPVGTGDSGCDVADQNGDGTVDPLDIGYVLARFGECP